jgi:DNA repair protein RecO
MMQFTTQGIVLSRTEFGEADRIITFLTPTHGKVRAMAKGVRKQKSKLAGGIELFSVSELSLIVGRSEINTLISTRLIKHYGQIVKDINRTNTGYELIKVANKATEDEPEAAYFHLLNHAFEVLDDHAVDLDLIALWFSMQLLKIAGHTPNLHTDNSGKKLQKEHTYNFEFDGMNFKPVEKNGDGLFNASHIQFLRLSFSDNSPKALQRIKGVEKLTKTCQPLIQTMLQTYIRI